MNNETANSFCAPALVDKSRAKIGWAVGWMVVKKSFVYISPLACGQQPTRLTIPVLYINLYRYVYIIMTSGSVSLCAVQIYDYYGNIRR